MELGRDSDTGGQVSLAIKCSLFHVFYLVPHLLAEYFRTFISQDHILPISYNGAFEFLLLPG